MVELVPVPTQLGTQERRVVGNGHARFLLNERFLIEQMKSLNQTFQNQKPFICCTRTFWKKANRK